MGIILNLISTVLRVLEVIIVVECLASWIVQDKSNEIMRFLNSITSPLLEPFRELQYKFLGDLPVDLSPIFAIVVIQVVERLLYIIF